MKAFLLGSVLVFLGFLVGFAVHGMFGADGLPAVAADCQDEPCPAPPCCNGDVNGDSGIDMADAVYILSYLFSEGPEPLDTGKGGSYALPATGQTRCYNKLGGEIDCSNADYPGQDGFYQKGCPMAGRFVDNGDGTVTDNCTGLTWQQATADTNDDGQISESDELTWAGALKYCEGLDLGGETDWRLPNVRELQSIVDYGRWDPSIDPVFRAAAASPWYWSSSCPVFPPPPHATSPAWMVEFGIGGIVDFDPDKDQRHYVRAVRGGL